MKYLILLILFFATFHFVYEGIIAPSLRIALRNRLFAIRDELRCLKIGGLSVADEKAFWLVHEGINSFINRLPYLTIYGRRAAMEAYRNDADLRARVEQRIEILTGCGNKAITQIFDKASMIVEEAFIVNMGGTFVYIIPGAVLVATLGSLKRLAQSLVLTPERDTFRVVPQLA